MQSVKIIATRILKGLRIIKVLRFGSDDVQEVNESAPFGDDSNPIKDCIAIYCSTSQRGENVIIGYINKNRLAEIGEKRIFSTNTNGNLSTYIWLHNDGTMDIGGDDDNMVRYSELKQGFDQLKQDHNDLVQKWNAFCSAYTPGSPATVGTPPTLASSTVNQSTASIDDCKIEEIKTL